MARKSGRELNKVSTIFGPQLAEKINSNETLEIPSHLTLDIRDYLETPQTGIRVDAVLTISACPFPFVIFLITPLS